VENLKFALRHNFSVARSQARITLTRGLANVPVFSGEGQREREARAAAFAHCNT